MAVIRSSTQDIQICSLRIGSRPTHKIAHGLLQFLLRTSKFQWYITPILFSGTVHPATDRTKSSFIYPVIYLLVRHHKTFSVPDNVLLPCTEQGNGPKYQLHLLVQYKKFGVPLKRFHVVSTSTRELDTVSAKIIVLQKQNNFYHANVSICSWIVYT